MSKEVELQEAVLGGIPFLKYFNDRMVRYNSVNHYLSVAIDRKNVRLSGVWASSMSVGYFLGAISRYINSADLSTEPIDSHNRVFSVRSVGSVKTEMFDYTSPPTLDELENTSHYSPGPHGPRLELLKVASPVGEFTFAAFEHGDPLIGYAAVLEPNNWRARVERCADVIDSTSKLKRGEGREVLSVVIKEVYAKTL